MEIVPIFVNYEDAWAVMDEEGDVVSIFDSEEDASDFIAGRFLSYDGGAISFSDIVNGRREGGKKDG